MKLRDLARLANTGAELTKTASETLESLAKAQDLYSQFHAGHGGYGRPPLRAEVPDLREATLVEIGALAGLAYVTTKGSERRPRIYDHRFETPRPLLAFSPDTGDLVIVRGHSSYRLNSEGWIVG